MNHQNPTLARLLAKENVSVQHGNYNTAWFDIKNRILGLPLWKDMGKDVYDLLVGHEVGHALYTPYEGWHDTPEKIKGVPRSYMNVVEDARIERFIQRDYPGLVGPFKRGYYDLEGRGLFNYPEDQTEIKLIDKINLQAKLGEMVEIDFNDEERKLYNKARYQTQTFEEVVELCKEILAYTQENTPELITPPPPEPVFDDKGMEIPQGPQGESPDPTGMPGGHDDYLPGDEDKESDKDESTNGYSNTETDSDGNPVDAPSDSGDKDDSDEEKKSDKSNVLDKGEGEEDISLTDDAHRKAERSLLDVDEKGLQPLFIREPSKAIQDYVMFSFKELHKSRQDALEMYENPLDLGILKDFKGYLAQVKKASNFAVKEFEMRKAGYQWQRAQTAKSGTLDVNKVYSYKYNEDIFARVTKLANAKNHGMIMMIDYSGSMSSTLSQVIDQLFHLVTFCKTVNIPFDVYAFTTGNPSSKQKDKPYIFRDGDLDMESVSMPLLISSSLKKREYTQALEGLYMKKLACKSRFASYYDEDYWDDYSVSGQMERWGSTPLNHCLVLGHRLIRDFKMKHQVDKMNLVVLSDGDSNHIRAYEDYDLKKKINKTKYERYSNIKIHVGGKLLTLSSNGHKATHELLQNISKRYRCTTIGFFISDRVWDFRSKLREADIWDPTKSNKEYRKNKCVSLKNAVGYDEFYLVKGGKKLDATEDDFEVKEDASTAQIRAGFKKFSASKKKNKVLLSNFGKAVA
jgi:hypothetical protein